MNDSQAGLLNSYDNTGFREDSDLDTSYENSDSDSQDRQHRPELSRQKILEEFEEQQDDIQEDSRMIQHWEDQREKSMLGQNMVMEEFKDI